MSPLGRHVRRSPRARRRKNSGGVVDCPERCLRLHRVEPRPLDRQTPARPLRGCSGPSGPDTASCPNSTTMSLTVAAKRGSATSAREQRLGRRCASGMAAGKGHHAVRPKRVEDRGDRVERSGRPRPRALRRAANRERQTQRREERRPRDSQAFRPTDLSPRLVPPSPCAYLACDRWGVQLWEGMTSIAANCRPMRCFGAHKSRTRRILHLMMLSGMTS